VSNTVVVYSICKCLKYSKSLYVVFGVTENAHDAMGITIIYCKEK